VVILREPDSDRGKPLTSELARDSEPERDLRIDDFSVTPEDRLNEPARAFPNPFD